MIVNEVMAGSINALAYDRTAGAVWIRSAKPGLGFVIGLAMIVNTVAAAAAGAILPLILNQLGRGPAQSAAIFLTTVTHIVGFVISY